jgi:hypothetical protein
MIIKPHHSNYKNIDMILVFAPIHKGGSPSRGGGTTPSFVGIILVSYKSHMNHMEYNLSYFI